MNKKIKSNSEIEYHPRLAILRISIIIILILMISIIIYKINNDDKILEKLNEEIIFEELYNETVPREDFSKGSFVSLKLGSNVEGTIDIIEKENRKYIRFQNFKITKNNNLKLVLSTDIYGNKRIGIADKLKGNVGTQEYILPENINFNVHKYLIFWDDNLKIPIAYAQLDNLKK